MGRKKKKRITIDSVATYCKSYDYFFYDVKIIIVVRRRKQKQRDKNMYDKSFLFY